MKHLYLPVMLLIAAAFASCEKQPVTENPSPVKESYVFSLKASADPATKTDYTSSGAFSWSANDQISVLFHDSEGTEKFFTLSNESGAGSSATFSGVIDAGFEIGSAADGTKWALYPASENHTFNGSLPSFFVPSATDYTADGYTANFPLMAQGDSEDLFEFKALGPAYRFTFTDIDDDIQTVKFTFENLSGNDVSGLVSLEADMYIGNYGYFLNFPSAGNKTVSFVRDVDANRTATFYVPVRYWGSYMPKITLMNAEDESTIVSKSATKSVQLTGTKVQPITVVASGSGTPWSFPSAYDIDWASETTEAAGDSGTDYDGIVCMKAKADANNLYVYFEVKKDALYDNSEYQYSNYSHLYIGNGTGSSTYWPWSAPYLHDFGSWIKYNNSPRYINWNTGFVGQNSLEHNGKYYYEIAIARSSFSALSGSSATLCFLVNKQYYINSWDGTETQVGFAPARWTSALTVEMPSME